MGQTSDINTGHILIGGGTGMQLQRYADSVASWGVVTSVYGLTGSFDNYNAAVINSYIRYGGSPGTFWFGDADNATPVSQKFVVQNVANGTSNTAGVDWTFSGSRGTGNATGGSIVFQVAPAGANGTTQNPLVNAVSITGNGYLRINYGIIANGTTGSSQALLSNSTGGLYWGSGGGGSGTPGGSATQVQFNDAGSFGGDSGLTYNKTTDTLTVANTIYMANSLVSVVGQSYAIAVGYALP